MTNQVVTLRPSATAQLGSWTVVGAATAHQATTDNVDTSYVQLTPRCWTDTQILKLSIPAPTLPAGAKIFSVRTRIRVQRVVGVTVWVPRVICWQCSREYEDDCVGGRRYYTCRKIVYFPVTRYITSDWVTQDLDSSTTNPLGTEWLVTPDFDQFEVHLGRDDSNANALRISEVYVDVFYNQPPTVSVTAPTGTQTANCRATITWAYTDTEQDPQQAWRGRLFSSAQYSAVGFDPYTSKSLVDTDWTTGDVLQWREQMDLVNGDYRGYIQVRQVWAGLGNLDSTIGFTQWTQNVAGAPVPVMVSAVVDTNQNRVLLTVQPGGPSPATVSYTLESSQDGGITWQSVRGGIQLNADGTNPVSLYDYEAPLNKVVKYRALAYRQVGSLRFVSAGYSNIVSATPRSNDFWLKDPLDPTLNSIIPIAYLGDQVTRQRSQGVFSPIAADGVQTFKVVVNGPQYGIEGTLNLIFKAADATDMWEAFKALDSSGRALLLQYPTGEQHYLTFGPGTTGSDMTYTWDMNPSTNKVRWRKAQVSYVEVARPAVATN